jgi:anti-sigma factor RsiW
VFGANHEQLSTHNGFYTNDEAMNTPHERDLIARALRDGLSAAEKEQWRELLEREPALRDRFAEDVALERALQQLPNVRISSNFTALVLQAATRPQCAKRRSWLLSWNVFRPGLAGAVASLVLVSVLMLSLVQHQQNVRRADMARGVRSFTEIAAAIGSSKAPAAEVFQNFDAIQRLSMPGDSEVDLELLVALQK